MPPRGKRAKTDNATSALIAALKFVSVAQKESGNAGETHCVLRNNTVTAFNGILAAGHTIIEDLQACPQSRRLIDALEKCGEDLAITQLDNNNLSIRSGKFKASVPCADLTIMPYAAPDQPCATITDKLKDGFSKISCIVSDTSENVVTASILLQAATMVSTNRHVMLEYWHGLDLPPNLVIPKAAAMAVAKSIKPLDKLGFSASSVTFWFQDGSWIRTQQYAEPWPNVGKVLNVISDPKPILPTFYAGLDAIASFSPDDTVYFSPDLIHSHFDTNLGATYEVTGLPEDLAFGIKNLKIIEPFVKSIDFTGVKGISYFFGDDIRGAIVGKV